MKKILLTMLCLELASCGNWINEASIENAIALCKDNGGIEHLDIFVRDIARCRNGAEYPRAAWFK